MNSLVRQIAGNFLKTTNANKNLILLANMCSAKTKYETLNVTVPKPFVYHVELNRPNKLNSLNGAMWTEIGECFDALHTDPDCRVIVLSGSGKLFCAGIDLQYITSFGPTIAEIQDVARKGRYMMNHIKKCQKSFNAIEKCTKPVITAVHSACVGAGVDMISGADIRYCSKDAFFQIKEVDIGMAADVGTLQRFPKAIGSDSLARELCYTARRFPAHEALSSGFVSKVFDDKESLITGALQLAEEIASKSPVAVQTTKQSMVFSRDHTVDEGLEHIANLNQFLLNSEDFLEAAMAQAMKSPNVTFSKL